MDEKLILSPMQFVLRAVYIVFTAMAALAFIVISFISDAWESVPPEKQHFAFVVVNASGAHFICSLAYALPCILICRLLPYWKVATSAAAGGAAYIYCALILQHRGLADSLRSEPWVSIFPFGQDMINLVQGPHLEAFFYFIPLVAAWGMAVIIQIILVLADYGLKRRAPLSKKMGAKPVRPRRSKSRT